MPVKPIIISPHARFEMNRRGLRQNEVATVIRSPGQVLPSRKERQIFQSKIGTTGRMLLRVIVKETAAAYHVITAYKTSKVAKYWKQT